ncbi:hypothetical protein EJ03DRAFT_367096 [Teratosphaeria nubilosa]|uniref:Uncharacterized protein n=1 Tax=Teratosphaeria nubilosa TaxID=161662 RepID=A0A6G1L2A1_9PEZI|nr:hypothetical protein EJ03DRAFT_367096 [Teratosphaeria nubilosa]
MTTIQGRVGTFDLRSQILTNARILWPIVEDLNEDEHAQTRDTPRFELLVVGKGPLINAEIVWCNRVGQWIIFIKTNETDSAEKAVDMLLQITMNMLSKHYEDNVFKEEEAERRDVDLLGYYYQPVPPSPFYRA